MTQKLLKLLGSLLFFTLINITVNAGTDTTQVGPEKGTLFLCGGEWEDTEIKAELKRLIGPDTAFVVLIPTASQNLDINGRLSNWRSDGYREVRVLHAETREEADTDDFAAVIDSATAVWCYGGNPYLLAERYRDTKVHDALWRLLHRGGFFGGTSAGAMIQCTWSIFNLAYPPEDIPDSIDINDYKFFDFLKNSTVLPHAAANGWDIGVDAINHYPDILGIGVADAAAAVIQGDTLRFHGKSSALYDSGYINNCEEEKCYQSTVSGETYNLHTRQFINRAPQRAGTIDDFHITTNEQFSHTFSPDLFEEINSDDTVHYFGELLGSSTMTSNFEYDSASMTLSGMSTRTGNFIFKIGASDQHGAANVYTIRIFVQNPVGITQNELENSTIIHYDYSTNSIGIHFSNEILNPTKVRVYNTLGVKLTEQTIVNQQVLNIETTNFLKGTYIVQIQSGSRSVTRKVLIY